MQDDGDDGGCADKCKVTVLTDKIKKSDRSDFEKKALQNLLKAGTEGIHASEYLIRNDISFDNLSYQPFGTGAGWHPDQTISFPDKYGSLPSPDDPFVLSNIAHEAMHLEQGPLVALSAYGELEAWQTGFKVLDTLNGPSKSLSDTQQTIVDLPLNHDSINLTTAVNYMLEDQNGRYLGGYLLYLTINHFPVQSRP